MVIGFGLKAKFWIVALICIAVGVGVAVAARVGVAVGSGAGVAVGVEVTVGRVWTPGWLGAHLMGTSKRSTAELRGCGPCMTWSLPPT
jgi:hypothetical protein